MSGLIDDAKDAGDKMKAGARELERKWKTQTVMQALNTTRKRSKKK